MLSSVNGAGEKHGVGISIIVQNAMMNVCVFVKGKQCSHHKMSKLS